MKYSVYLMLLLPSHVKNSDTLQDSEVLRALGSFTDADDLRRTPDVLRRGRRH